MSRFDSATVAATAFAGGLLVLALAGCAQIADLAHRVHREDFPDYTSAEVSWVGVDIPEWIPGDATDLRNLATLDETVAVIRVVSDSPLVGDCTLAERRGLPALSADWSTEEWPDEVARCGDYEVMPMDDGWLGWFSAAEPGQTPG